MLGQGGCSGPGLPSPVQVTSQGCDGCPQPSTPASGGQGVPGVRIPVPHPCTWPLSKKVSGSWGCRSGAGVTPSFGVGVLMPLIPIHGVPWVSCQAQRLHLRRGAGRGRAGEEE